MIRLVKAYKIETLDGLDAVRDSFIKKGFEGIMLKNIDFIYKYSLVKTTKRNQEQQKYKLKDYDWFQIIDIRVNIQTTNSFNFVLLNSNNVPFDVVGGGSVELRAKYLDGLARANIGRYILLEYNGVDEFTNPVTPVIYIKNGDYVFTSNPKTEKPV